MTLLDQWSGKVRRHLSYLLMGTRTFGYTDDPPRTPSLYSPRKQTEDDYIFEYSKLPGGCTVLTGQCLPMLQMSGSSGHCRLMFHDPSKRL